MTVRRIHAVLFRLAMRWRGLRKLPALTTHERRLCGLENVVFTPHVATLTRESRLQMEVECVVNLLEELAR